MQTALISLQKAREIAHRWRGTDGSKLDAFSATGAMAAGILSELEQQFARPLSDQDREDLIELGVYLQANLYRERRRLIDRKHH